MRMSSSPENQLLSQAAARRLLERAGEIDSDTTSLETLRAAAREAGISEAAFETALTEIRSAPVQAVAATSKRRLALTISAAVTILAAAMALVIIPRIVLSSRADVMTDHDVAIDCLPTKLAQAIAQGRLNLEGNEVQLTKGSRTLSVRATEDQVVELNKALDETRRDLGSCIRVPP
jgi:hypothetical protein